MSKCECFTETNSILDIRNFRGLVSSRPCCHKCFKILKANAKTNKEGDIVDGQNMLRWHNRDYPAMTQLQWLFHLSDK